MLSALRPGRTDRLSRGRPRRCPAPAEAAAAAAASPPTPSSAVAAATPGAGAPRPRGRRHRPPRAGGGRSGEAAPAPLAALLPGLRRLGLGVLGAALLALLRLRLCVSMSVCVGVRCPQGHGAERPQSEDACAGSSLFPDASGRDDCRGLHCVWPCDSRFPLGGNAPSKERKLLLSSRRGRKQPREFWFQDRK